MFLNLLTIVLFVAPFPAIYMAISKRVKPYLAIGYGITAGAMTMLAIFALAFLFGESFGDQLNARIDQAVELIVQNKDVLANVGLNEISNAKAISLLTEMYKTMAMLLPSVLIILEAIVSYIEYTMLVKIRYAQTSGYKPYAYLRNYTLTNNDVIGWFIIYSISYLIKFAGIGIGEVAVMNINIMVNAIISVQAVGLIFFVTYVKQRPRIFAIIISISLWIIPIGKSILFLLGVMDLIVNLRGKFRENFNG